ncbi:MAG: hypothetical protein J6039_00110 [Alphaproteobacteria bacterium]|nr:hypothetical protein [Alphaproteobacteria bacterium]
MEKTKENTELELAREIAETADVSSAPNSVVLYSTSYQPTDVNKREALQYMAEHKGCSWLDNTECGQKLIALNLATDYKNPEGELMKIWARASERFIAQASGNITAFVAGADPRSTFVTVELPTLLKNDKIVTVNGTDKYEFARHFYR